MTPQQKAKEIFDKMYYKIQPDELGKDQESAKQCALIAVDEVIKSNPINPRKYSPFETPFEMVNKAFIYWQEVKQEIEKL